MKSLRILLFVALALASGVVLAALTPIGMVADETAHAIRADSITHGKFLGRRLPSQFYGAEVMQGYAFADSQFFWAAVDNLFKDHRLQTKQNLEKVRQMRWSGRLQLFEIGMLAGYMPVFYLPAAAGLGAARLLGAQPYDALQIGRLVNVLAFVAIGAAGLLAARRGRGLLLCTLSVPMTLSLAASFNQDGLLIAASVLAAGLASRAWDKVATPEEIPLQPWFWLAALVIALIGMVKPPYLSLGVMLLLPLPRWSSRADREALWRRLAVLALVCVPAVLWLVFAIPSATGSPTRDPYSSGPLWPGVATVFRGTDTAAQLHVMLAHPWRVLVVLPVWTFLADFANLWHHMIGVLGWLDVPMPRWFYPMWLALVAVSVASDMLPRRESVPSRGRPWQGAGEAALLLLAVLATIWAIYVSQYLSWTDVGKDAIDGPSGRYFLPVVPLVAMALPVLAVPALAQRFGRLLGWAPVLGLVVGLYVVPRVLLGAYYLP